MLYNNTNYKIQRMKFKDISTCLFLCLFLNYSFGQSKKDVKENKIKSVTEFVTFTENGKEITYKASYIAFNKKGEVIEETEFTKNGTIKKRETKKYDVNDNKTEETFFELKEKKTPKPAPEKVEITNIRTVFKYNAHNDKIEIIELDVTNSKLITKQLFFYNNKGEKDKEETYNAENKIIKKATFFYNNKGLKTEKKNFNENNILELTKKYVYEF